MPSLLALGLDVYVFHGNLDGYYQLLSSLGKHVPQLRRLTLAIRQGTTTDIKLWKIKFPWRQLTELVVPLNYIVSCQQLLICCPDLETLKDHPHLSTDDQVIVNWDISEVQAVVLHSKLSFIDMSPSLALTLLDHIRCPALTRLSLPCPREYQPDGEVFQRFIQRSECTIRIAELVFNDYHSTLASPNAFLSALPELTVLMLSFGADSLESDLSLIECLADRAVVGKLRVLTITATIISRSTWDEELKGTLIRVLSARFQHPDESSTATNLQAVVVVLGRETYMLPGGRTNGSVYYVEGYSSESEEDKRRLHEDYSKDCTIEDLVDADFIEFRKLKERGLDIRLSVWKGRTLIRYV